MGIFVMIDWEDRRHAYRRVKIMHIIAFVEHFTFYNFINTQNVQ